MFTYNFWCYENLFGQPYFCPCTIQGVHWWVSSPPDSVSASKIFCSEDFLRWARTSHSSMVQVLPVPCFPVVQGLSPRFLAWRHFSTNALKTASQFFLGEGALPSNRSHESELPSCCTLDHFIAPGTICSQLLQSTGTFMYLVSHWKQSWRCQNPLSQRVWGAKILTDVKNRPVLVWKFSNLQNKLAKNDVCKLCTWFTDLFKRVWNKSTYLRR